MEWYRKGLITSIIILYSAMLQSCPECIPPEPSPPNESDIIFSGKALNSFLPGVYLVNADGFNLQELIPNAEIFSPISDDGKFVFLRKRLNGTDQLFIYNMRNGKFNTIIDDTTFSDRKYPVLSKNGEFTAFFNGNVNLVTGRNDGVWPFAQYDICPLTLPTFSPDSKYIAFFIGDSLEAPLRINVVRADNPGVLVKYKELSFGISGLKGLAKLDWSHQDYILYSYTRSPILDKIGVWNMNNDAESFEIDLKENLGAFNPLLSPDKSKILFTARDGNLWTRNFTEDTLSPAFWEDLTRVNSGEFLAYPSWSKDGMKILYTRYFDNTFNNPYSGKLEMLINVGTDSIKTLVVSDNARQAFWRR